MKHRHTRLKIAFALAGRGSPVKFAEEHGVRPDYVMHLASGTCSNGDGGRMKKSSRIEMAIDRFIRRVFAEHGEVLRLKPEDRTENACEHGDHSAPPGMRFCSKACARCEHESTNAETGCDNICGRAMPAEGTPRPAVQGR